MRYLCNNHRDEFTNNPQQAAEAWQVIMLQARELFHVGDWQKATVIYGNAFEISELLLKHNQSQFSVDRYLRSALEFAYAARKSQVTSNLNALINHVQRTIKNIQHSMALTQLIQPIDEVINLPIHLADHWMQALLSLDSIEERVLH